ncbi:hypothetical protein ZHAS_00013521 [Anopheles sinensis]|uniref:Uncharacterized protein n=1 Tax=Anopheles sinensis TaxID=74873 RepID=A0A084W619_ANOSI|nr:hypothetical protein ZHAS_00013521 [Anopheles sinensis]
MCVAMCARVSHNTALFSLGSPRPLRPFQGMNCCSEKEARSGLVHPVPYVYDFVFGAGRPFCFECAEFHSNQDPSPLSIRLARCTFVCEGKIVHTLVTPRGLWLHDADSPSVWLENPIQLTAQGCVVLGVPFEPALVNEPIKWTASSETQSKIQSKLKS